MNVKRHMRDLGHEQSGPYARRLVGRERMAAGVRRLPRLRRFRKAVGKKATALLSAGLTPSWSHGAATMGLLPSALKTQRTVAAQLLGLNKLQSRSMASTIHSLAAAMPSTDPSNLLTQLWDDRINPKLAGSCAQGFGLIVAVRNHRGMESTGRWVR